MTKSNLRLDLIWADARINLIHPDNMAAKPIQDQLDYKDTTIKALIVSRERKIV